MQQVKFKMPYLFPNTDADTVYGEIKGIGENATAEQIVEMAKDESTESHKCFEWDNEIAGHKYRITQAQHLVRQLVIVEQAEKSRPTEIRAMYTSKAGGYKETKLILQEKDEYEALLERAKNELRAFKQKYAMLTELENIFALID